MFLMFNAEFVHSKNVKILPITKLISEMDNTRHREPTCYFGGCGNKSPINSHTISENSLYKLSSNLIDVLTPQKKVNGALREIFITSIDKEKFSTFVGFCNKCDDKYFKEIDSFNGEMTSEKATLIHYRVICYGLNHVQTQILKNNILLAPNCVSNAEGFKIHDIDNNDIQNSSDDLYKLIKSGVLNERLQRCLEQHLSVKKILEGMIKSKNFESIRFEYLIGDAYKNPLFFGRYNFLMTQGQDAVLDEAGYSNFPWVTYMTLLSKQKSYLTFCWLKQHEEYAKFLENLTRENIADLAYTFSDDFAISQSLFKNKSLEINRMVSRRLY